MGPIPCVRGVAVGQRLTRRASRLLLDPGRARGPDARIHDVGRRDAAFALRSRVFSGPAPARDEAERADSGEQKDVRVRLGDDARHDGRDDVDRARHRDRMTCRYRDVVDVEVEVPAVSPDPKLKCLGVLSKSRKMPPLSVEVTTPVRLSVTSTLLGVVPGGAVNETSRSKWLPVYVNGAPVNVNEPRLSTSGVAGAPRLPTKPPAKVTLNVEFVYVRPEPGAGSAGRRTRDWHAGQPVAAVRESRERGVDRVCRTRAQREQHAGCRRERRVPKGAYRRSVSKGLHVDFLGRGRKLNEWRLVPLSRGVHPAFKGVERSSAEPAPTCFSPLIPASTCAARYPRGRDETRDHQHPGRRLRYRGVDDVLLLAALDHVDRAAGAVSEPGEPARRERERPARGSRAAAEAGGAAGEVIRTGARLVRDLPDRNLERSLFDVRVHYPLRSHRGARGPHTRGR